MKKRKYWIILITVIFLLSFAGAAIYGLMRRGRENKIAQSSAPTVQLTLAGDEELVAPDSEILILASAFGRTPITNIQLWMDGQLLETQSNTEGSAGTFNASFLVTMPNGQHMVSARTVDAEGLVGQTLPVPIAASPEYQENVPALYTAEGEESLEDIAGKVGLETEDLEVINPDLGDGVLPAGTDVNLPAGDPSAQTAPVPAAPPPPTTTGGGPVTIPNLPMLAAVANYSPPAVGFGDLVGSTDALLPEAPRGLQASVENCQLTLTWQDNSPNEDVFNIWISGLGIPARIIGTANSKDRVGQVWYQVPSPPAGIYSLWVESVNAYGKQPSEPVWIGVPAQQCAHYTAAYLQVEIKGITFSGPSYEHLYTYISVEGAPERRFPVDDSDFFVITSIWGDFWGDIHPENSDEKTLRLLDNNIMTVPIPADGALDLSGKGMGWTGSAPFPLGDFTGSIPASEWDGSNLTIESQNFRIILTVQPFGEMIPQGTATFFDPSIPAPENLWVRDTGNQGIYWEPDTVETGWVWSGEESAISGFTIFLNDQPIRTVSPDEREIFYTLPVLCGEDLVFQVAANTVSGQSVKSEPKISTLEACRVMAEITLFDMQVWRSTFTNVMYRDDCARLQIRYVLYGMSTKEVSLEQPMRTEKNSPSSYPWTIRCNKFYRFSDLALPNKIIVPIDPTNPELIFGAVIDTPELFYAGWVQDELRMSLDEWARFEDVSVLRTTKDELDAEISFLIKGIAGYEDDDLAK